jgi:hypothetical protein
VFLGLLDPDPDPLARGVVLLSFSKNSKKNLNLLSTVLGLLFDFLPLNNAVKVPSKSNMQKNFFLS